MAGRIYRLRKKSRVNYFDPATYEAAVKKIDDVWAANAYQTAEIKTSDTSIGPFLKEVLEHNGITIKTVLYSSGRRVKYKIEDRTQRDKAVDLLQKMKNDEVLDVDFSGRAPVGHTLNGVEVPLVGYTEEKANSGDKGKTSISFSSTESSSGAEEEKSSPNWLLIGGLSVVGLIAVLAIVKIIRK